MEHILVPIVLPRPPSPSPGVSKSLLPGGKQIKNKYMFDGFLGFNKKTEKTITLKQKRRNIVVVVRRPSVVFVVVVRLLRNRE